MPTPTQSYSSLALQLNAFLPQTQCQRCGYEGCLPYAQALADGEAKPNRCPPGGNQGMRLLANTLGVLAEAIDESCGMVSPKTKAHIKPELCIGCTKCIEVCPTDAIVGAPKRLHYVIEQFCTGCDLCLPPCPVDCIDMIALESQWSPWPNDLIAQAKTRYEAKQSRLLPTSSVTNKSIEPISVEPKITKPISTKLTNTEPVLSVLEKARLKAKMRLAAAKHNNEL